MNRRQLVTRLGTLAAGASLAAGTGAFGSVEADRQVSVSVENDREAYLRLTPTDSDFSSMTNKSTLQFAFDGEVAPAGGTADDTGDGVAPNSVYEFLDLFQATNQGPDDIVIFGQSSQESRITTDIITEGRSQPLTSDNPSTTVTTGSSQAFGLQLTIGDVAPQTVETSVSITAVSADSERYPDAL